MTSNSTSASASSLDPSGTVPDFYVVPIRRIGGSDDSVEQCLYYDSKWNRVDADSLEVSASQAFVTLMEGTNRVSKEIQQALKMIGWEVNTQVTLFNATAKTLHRDCNLPPNYFPSGSAGEASVVFPIMSNTCRGVILVFRFPIEGLVQSLIATADPEIKAGSSSTDGA